MRTQKVNTRFMNGNKDVEGVIFDILCNEYGISAVCTSGVADEDCIYSDGFISAIASGLIPELELVPNQLGKKGQEYHHVILNDECYVMYFKEAC